jgi:hypothetical protein
MYTVSMAVSAEEILHRSYWYRQSPVTFLVQRRSSCWEPGITIHHRRLRLGLPEPTISALMAQGKHLLQNLCNSVEASKRQRQVTGE